MDPTSYLKFLEQFKEKKVLVVGDFCLDEYLYGNADRMSPEAPIPRVVLSKKVYIPGAAGNVTCGIRSLGAETYTIGVIGEDAFGEQLLKEFNNRGIHTKGMVALEGRNTPTYSRVVSDGKQQPQQQLIRFDLENDGPIPEGTREHIKQLLVETIPDVDAVIVADYDEVGNVGLINQNLLQTIVETAQKHNKILIGDSRDQLKLFKGFTAIVPNEIEASKAYDQHVSDDKALATLGATIRDDLQLTAAVITRSEHGMVVFEQNRVHTVPALAKQVVDVTGAGDTVTCLITLSLLSGSSFSEAAELASYGASIAVAKKGTAAVTTDELKDLLQAEQTTSAEKLITREQLQTITQGLKQENKKTVFLNGYFDPPHVGHMHLMSKAKDHGDVLIVALNTDQSVRQNKGPDRPFLSQTDRAKIIAGIEAVDYVVLYDELTPIKLLQELQPDVLIKGDNYTPDEVVGKNIIESYGGKIAFVETLKGMSSDTIVEAIKEKGDKEQ